MSALAPIAVLVGTRRIGREIALQLARSGVGVGVIYRASGAEAADLVTTVQTLGVPAVAVQSTLDSDVAVERAFQGIEDTIGPMGSLVNLAADYERTPWATLDAAAWDRGMVAARTCYLLALHAARRMARNSGPTRGRIVLFGDWASGETPYRDYLPYLTGKAAVHFLTRGLAVELAREGILVNAIAPGPTVRPPDIPEDVWNETVVARTPLRRQSSINDIVELTMALLQSETITGEVIRVDSGRHLAPSGLD
ncbi:MAG: SDR family oxidoreductase [Planctomycetota bacterium]|nr:MAG: SDR family oxidoreductase [Planctomycetota bacterium]